jgi:hypothetical protein
MLNFDLLYKKTKNDSLNKEREKNIAIKLRDKCELNNHNIMEALIETVYNAYNLQEKSLKNVTDFPSLSVQVINEYLALSGYHTKSSRSYIKEFRDRNICYDLTERAIKNYVLNKELLGNLQNNCSKLIAFEMSSRHKRGKKKNTNDPVDSDEDFNEETKPKKVLREKYKVFINYVPSSDINEWEKIKSKTVKLYWQI